MQFLVETLILMLIYFFIAIILLWIICKESPLKSISIILPKNHKIRKIIIFMFLLFFGTSITALGVQNKTDKTKTTIAKERGKY